MQSVSSLILRYEPRNDLCTPGGSGGETELENCRKLCTETFQSGLESVGKPVDVESVQVACVHSKGLGSSICFMSVCGHARLDAASVSVCITYAYSSSPTQSVNAFVCDTRTCFFSEHSVLYTLSDPYLTSAHKPSGSGLKQTPSTV